jgi:hypothetical protein
MNVRGFHFLLAFLLLFPVAGLSPARAEVDDPNAAATNVLLTVPRKDYSIAGLISHLPGAGRSSTASRCSPAIPVSCGCARRRGRSASTSAATSCSARGGTGSTRRRWC